MGGSEPPRHKVRPSALLLANPVRLKGPPWSHIIASMPGTVWDPEKVFIKHLLIEQVNQWMHAGCHDGLSVEFHIFCYRSTPIFFFYFFFFFGGTGVWTQGFTLVKQVLNYLRHISLVHFALIILEMRLGLASNCDLWISASKVARITWMVILFLICLVTSTVFFIVAGGLYIHTNNRTNIT
jgi:hypothetical protein